MIETCSCRASIEVIWTEPKSEYDRAARRESERAKAEIAAFRKAHKTCRDRSREAQP